jgi:hypothetical protein
MLRDTGDDKLPQDGAQVPSVETEGEAKFDAAPLPPSPEKREGARRLSFPEPEKPEGAHRLSFPEPEKPKGVVRRLSFPEPEPMNKDRGARRLNISDEQQSEPQLTRGSTGSRALNIPEIPEDVKRELDTKPEVPARRVLHDAEPVVAPPPVHRTHGINPPPPVTPAAPPAPVRQQRAQTKADLLVEKVLAANPGMQVQRIRGRIDTCLAMSLSDILDWGNRNLVPLQNTSNAQGEISAELSRIDASGWISRTMEASCKPPSFLDRFNHKPQPSYWEGMLQKTRAELQQFVIKLDKMKGEFFREITDLHLDAVAILACVNEYSDDALNMSAQNRGKTLLLAHQTAFNLQQSIERTLMQCAQYMEKIDEVLTVTIPNWKIALQNRP